MSKNGKPRQKNAWEVDFVRCDLDKNAIAELKSWNVSPSEVFEKVEAMVADGYKITFSSDEDATFVGAYATTKATHPQNPKMCLGSRGSSAVHALKALLFKHYVLLEQEWGSRVRTVDSEEAYG